MNARENLLRTIRFERPERIPMRFSIGAACWNHYDQQQLEELMLAHPLLFPDFKPRPRPFVPDYAPWQRAGAPYLDPWGCTWETAEDGITGAVRKHPLASWDDFENYVPPDPVVNWGWGKRDWDAYARSMAERKERGVPARDGLRHGHTFMTLTYIRGYEALIFDMVDEEPRLWKLIEMVESFNLANARRMLDSGVEIMGYAEDLGMQRGPMISPDHFLKYIKPSYDRLMAPAREAGVLIHMHSDGDIRDLADMLVDSGVQSLNLQDLVNGIDWIAARFKGKVCIDLDIDRQKITRYGTPQQIDALIREEVEKLGAPEGGLSMVFGMYPGMPLENVAALMDAMERYSTHWSE
jgi:uroporphyrinogen decarboxylase